MAEISIRQWIENYNSSKYDSQDVKVQCEAGWYDWFCRNESLCGKTKRLAPKVKQLAKSSKVDVDNWYVWFKNNCPVFGSLYDDIRFADIKTGDVIYTIAFVKKYGQTVELWGKENDFKHPLVIGDWEDIKEYFGI